MKNRNPVTVALLGLVTCGIYSWYWLVKTKGEMNKLGEKIPTAWLWLIPFVGTIIWLWKYSEGVVKVTNSKMSSILSFVLLLLTGIIGQAIIQDAFNKVEVPAVASFESAPSAGVNSTTSAAGFSGGSAQFVAPVVADAQPIAPSVEQAPAVNAAPAQEAPAPTNYFNNNL